MLNNSNDDIIRKIEVVKIALADHIKKAEGEQLKSFEVIVIIERSFSTIVYLKINMSKASRQLVMKTINHHPINKSINDCENQAVVEYNILKDLYPKFQKIEKCSVPRPILVIPGIETYVMEFVEGELLIDKLRWDRYLSSQKKFIELQDYFYNSGRWLRYFQEFTRVREADPKVLDLVMVRAEDRLRLIEKSGHPSCRKNALDAIRVFLKDQLKKLSGTKIPVCGRHSDFHPLNILAGQNGVTVIDFMGYHNDCVAVDVLKMMVHLEDEKKSFTASSHRVENLKEKFLEGYGRAPFVPIPALLICEAMQRIVSIWGDISTAKRHFHHYLEANFRVRNHVSWLISEERKALLWPSK